MAFLLHTMLSSRQHSISEGEGELVVLKNLRMHKIDLIELRTFQKMFW